MQREIEIATVRYGCIESRPKKIAIQKALYKKSVKNKIYLTDVSQIKTQQINSVYIWSFQGAVKHTFSQYACSCV